MCLEEIPQKLRAPEVREEQRAQEPRAFYTWASAFFDAEILRDPFLMVALSE